MMQLYLLTQGFGPVYLFVEQMCNQSRSFASVKIANAVCGVHTLCVNMHISVRN